MNVQNFNKCPKHSDVLVLWEGDTKCPFCVLLKANEILAGRVERAKKKLKKFLPKKVNKKRMDDIPF